MNLGKAKYFSLLNARIGYHQIAISERSKKYLAFSTPFGAHTYNRMPMGLKTACEIYQRVMTEMLQGLEGVHCYLDDVIVTGVSVDDDNANLKSVIDRLHEYGVKLSRDKCTFAQTKLSFLGHCLS